MKASKLGVPVTKEGLSWEILGKRISYHVARSAVHEDHFASSNTVAKSVDSEVDVFGPFTMNRIHGHETACTVVLVQGSRGSLRESQVS
jgi:hypothetical protein